ncbi:hypothetical protein RF55_12704 [Lasius niger]|uniref:Uncharacterized protein n=1 Tax=Lasius niger TaxID=67767 RepID=A0A0J7KBZ2_LASNI|nr:hypothetical protein RF55_12704 [Lasius niger]
MEIRHVSENEQNLEMTNLAGEIGEREITENIPPNYTSTSIRNTRKERSMQQLSRTMIDVQLEKLQLEKEEIRLKKKTLKVNKKILLELKHIRSQLNDK